MRNKYGKIGKILNDTYYECEECKYIELDGEKEPCKSCKNTLKRGEYYIKEK